jgi:hypothetical protein
MIDEDHPIVKQYPTINPYLNSIALLVTRLLWDIHPESWRSRQKIRLWKDKYKGQKAVILCNGPSLLKSDLSLLEGIFTFGLNKINLLFDKSNFRPSGIVAINSYVIEQNRHFFNQTDIPLFLDKVAIKQVKQRKNVIFLHSADLPKFARDCSISINQGFTVTYVALQLAFHLGFKEVALIGADHKFAVEGPANKTVVSGDKDESHFDPNYFAGGVKWQLPDLCQSEISYLRAKQVYETFDRKVVNATEGGCLEIFPRVSLAEFVDRK